MPAIRHTYIKNRGRHAGFSLVEVLIALIIMSVGMLGIAGLYVHSMQAGRTSTFRHHAVTLAGDIADRIRANPGGGAAYAGAESAATICINGAINCTPAQMAADDIHLWNDQAEETLPAGNVQVVFDNAVDPPTYAITVGWSEPTGPLSYVIKIPVIAN